MVAHRGEPNSTATFDGTRSHCENLQLARLTRLRRSLRSASLSIMATLGGLAACAPAPSPTQPLEVRLLRDYFAAVNDDTLKVTDGPDDQAGASMRLGVKYRTDDGCDVGRLGLVVPSSLAPRPGDQKIDSCVATGFFLGVYQEMNCELSARVDQPGTDRSLLFVIAWCRGRVT
jgi:hypothetical protein